MVRKTTKLKRIFALAGLLACWLNVSPASGQSNPSQAIPDKPQPAQPAMQKAPAAPAPSARSLANLPARSVVNERAANQYRLIWGIDNILVKQIAEGALIRFSFRVLDPVKANPLNDDKLKPQLVDETSHYALQIPVMDQVGQLRQTATPEAGREYWMVFSNKGGYVKPGNRVDIIIGQFRANGLIVQ